MESGHRSRRDGGQPLPVGRTLGRNPTIAALAGQARRLERLQQLIARRLPASLQFHWSLAAARPGHVLLVVDSATWGTRLRFCWPTIRTVLEEQGISPPAQPRLRVEPAVKAPEPGQPHQLSRPAITAVLRAAESSSPELADAWRRMLERHLPSGGGDGN